MRNVARAIVYAHALARVGVSLLQFVFTNISAGVKPLAHCNDRATCLDMRLLDCA